MKNRKTMTAVMLVVGILLLWGGAGGFYSLYTASQNCERATGTVQWINTQRVYRHRKIRYDSQMLISYPTPKYGNVSVSMKNYNPLRKIQLSMITEGAKNILPSEFSGIIVQFRHAPIW